MSEETLTPDELNEVNRLINQFMAGDITDLAGERPAVQRSSVLPALEDWSAFGGISRAGRIVWVDRDPPSATRLIENIRIQRCVLFEASRRYPSLRSLCPMRPVHARDCHHCGGSGRVSFGIEQETIQIGDRQRSVREIENGFRCFCGGLGWLLDGDGWSNGT